MSLEEAAKALVKYIRENNVTDDYADDGGGYVDTWVSGEFGILIEAVEKELQEAVNEKV